MPILGPCERHSKVPDVVLRCLPKDVLTVTLLLPFNLNQTINERQTIEKEQMLHIFNVFSVLLSSILFLLDSVISISCE